MSIRLSQQGQPQLSLCEGRCSTSNNTALDLSNPEENVNETKQYDKNQSSTTVTCPNSSHPTSLLCSQS